MAGEKMSFAYSGKIAELMKADITDIHSFKTVWEGIFTELMGVDFVPLLKRLVGEIQVTAPDQFNSSIEAAAFTSRLGKLNIDGGATITGLVMACYSELMMLTVRGAVTPGDALGLCSDWWHAIHTIPQKAHLASKGMTEDDLRKMQNDINNKTFESQEFKEAADKAGPMMPTKAHTVENTNEKLRSGNDISTNMRVIKGGKSN